MVILSDNPYEMPKEELAGLKVEKLILGGKDYKPQSGSVAGTVLKGMLSNNKA